jgi:hypothetical protein
LAYDIQAAIRRLDTVLARTGVPPTPVLESATEVQAELAERFGDLDAETQFSIAEYVAAVTAGISGQSPKDHRMAAAAWVYGIVATRLAAPLRKAEVR